MTFIAVDQLKDFICNKGICRQGSTGLMHTGGGHFGSDRMLFSQTSPVSCWNDMKVEGESIGDLVRNFCLIRNCEYS